MGLFKSKEEKQREIQERQRLVRERERLAAEQSGLESKIKNLHRYPGSLSEYNSLMNEEYEIMDTGRARKFVFVDDYAQVYEKKEKELIKKLINEGCTGVIRYVPVAYTAVQCNNFGYGVPVRKK